MHCSVSSVLANKISRFNPVGVTLQVVQANGRITPTTSVDLGEDIKLRLIYNRGSIETGMNVLPRLVKLSLYLQPNFPKVTVCFPLFTIFPFYLQHIYFPLVKTFFHFVCNPVPFSNSLIVNSYNPFPFIYNTFPFLDNRQTLTYFLKIPTTSP